MFSFSKLKLNIHTCFSGCLSVSDEKFYTIENIHENNVVEEIAEKYDTKKWYLLKGVCLILVVTLD